MTDTMEQREAIARAREWLNAEWQPQVNNFSREDVAEAMVAFAALTTLPRIEQGEERDDAFEESVVSLHRYDTPTDRERAKEAVSIARLRTITAPPPPVEQGEERAREVLAAWRPKEMTPETAPEWLRELSPEEYARRRNEENASALFSLKVSGDWLRVAASMLHTAGTMNPSEFGSYGHSCIIVADALIGTREAILAALASEASAYPRKLEEDLAEAVKVLGAAAAWLEQYAEDNAIAARTSDGGAEWALHYGRETAARKQAAELRATLSRLTGGE